MAEVSAAPLIELRLYVARNAPNSSRAIANLTRICHHYVGERYQLEIVDVWEQPERALQDGVIATPLLIRLYPEPTVLLLGDLRDTENVVAALGFTGDSPLHEEH